MAKVASAAEGMDESVSHAGKPYQGRISSTTVVRLDLDDGLSIIGPEDIVFQQGSTRMARGIVDTICKFIRCGDIIDDILGGGGSGGGGGGGCTEVTVKTSDGGTVTIKICPPSKMA